MANLADTSTRSLLATLLTLAAVTPAGAATRRAFVTSATCNGDLRPCSAAVGDTGVEAANNICQELAALAGLTVNGETFRAWLSDTTADAYCNVLGLAGQRFAVPPCGVATLPAAGPWERFDLVPYAESVDALTTSGAISTGVIDENGVYTPSSFFQTGTNADGTLRPTHFCNGWIDGTFDFNVSGGNTDVLAPDWGAGASTSCIAPKRLICLEVGAGDPLDYPSAPGALAFVTSTSGSGDLGTWAGSGGVDGLPGADAVCRARAAAAWLPTPDSFIAYLSDGVIDAADRLAINGPWERVDGVKIADSIADLTDGTLDDAILYDELDGRLFEPDAWTGTLENGTSTTAHCVGWTSDLPGDMGTTGRPWRSELSWTGGASPPCTGPNRLFCFSNRLVLGWDSFESGDFFRWSVAVVGDTP